MIWFLVFTGSPCKVEYPKLSQFLSKFFSKNTLQIRISAVECNTTNSIVFSSIRQDTPFLGFLFLKGLSPKFEMTLRLTISQSVTWDYLRNI